MNSFFSIWKNHRGVTTFRKVFYFPSNLLHKWPSIATGISQLCFFSLCSVSMRRISILKWFVVRIRMMREERGKWPAPAVLFLPVVRELESSSPELLPASQISWDKSLDWTAARQHDTLNYLEQKKIKM